MIERYLGDIRRNFDNTFPSAYMDRVESAVQSEDFEEAIHYLRLIDAVSKTKKRPTSQNSSAIQSPLII